MISKMIPPRVPTRTRPRNPLLPVLTYPVCRFNPSPPIPPPPRHGAEGHGTGVRNNLIQPERGSKPARDSHRKPKSRYGVRVRDGKISPALPGQSNHTRSSELKELRTISLAKSRNPDYEIALPHRYDTKGGESSTETSMRLPATGTGNFTKEPGWLGSTAEVRTPPTPQNCHTLSPSILTPGCDRGPPDPGGPGTTIVPKSSE